MWIYAIIAASFAIDVALLVAFVAPERLDRQITSEQSDETTEARRKPPLDFNNYRS